MGMLLHRHLEKRQKVTMSPAPVVEAPPPAPVVEAPPPAPAPQQRQHNQSRPR